MSQRYNSRIYYGGDDAQSATTQIWKTKSFWIGVVIGAVLVAIVCGLVYVILKAKKKEGFSAAQKLKLAAQYASQPNALMPSDKRTPSKSKLLLPIGDNARGSSPMSYLLPSSGVQKEVAEPAKADVSAAPPVIGGTENESPESSTKDASGLTLNVSAEESTKAGASTMNGVDFHDKSVPDTSDLPATVQNGVIESPAKEGYTGGNTRVNPQFLQNGSFGVIHKMQKDGISTGKEGFRPSKTQVYQ